MIGVVCALIRYMYLLEWDCFKYKAGRASGRSTCTGDIVRTGRSDTNTSRIGYR